MEKLLHNPDFISTLCGAAAFAVVFLIWIALVENDQRLKQAMANLERVLVPRSPKPKRPRTAAT